MQFLIPVKQITAMLPDEAPLIEASRLIEKIQTEARTIAEKHLATSDRDPVEICLTDNNQPAFAAVKGPDATIPPGMVDAIMTDLKAMLEERARKGAQVQ